MANTVSLLSYANTFGEWVNTTNKLAQENNDLAANNYTKPTGTLVLNDNSLGLQVANNAIFGGQLQVLGIGSSARIENNLRVDSQTYLTNTTLSLVASGQANIGGPLLALSSGTGLTVSNNAIINGTLNVGKTIDVVGAATFGNTMTITGATSISNSLYVLTDATVHGDIIAEHDVLVDFDIEARNITARGSMFSDGLEVTGDGSFTGNVVVDQNATIYGQMVVDGEFIISGDTVYTTNTFTLNANSDVAINSTYGVNRGTAGADAELRWNEAQDYWDIRDVNNSSSYSKILTANLISQSITSTSTETLVSSNVANTLNNSIVALGISVQGVVGGQLAAVDAFAASGYTQANAANNLATTAFNKANTAASTFVGTTGRANSLAGSISLTSTNGVTLVGSGNTVTISTPQNLQANASPTFASLSLTSPLAVAQGGTGAQDKATALYNLTPSTAGVPAGYVLATGGAGGSTFYWAAGGTGGGGGAVPGTTIQSNRLTYTANGTGVSYTTPTYVPGASQLRVYYDGVRQFTDGYTETSPTVVTFTTSPPSGTKVLIEVDGYINNPYYANTIAFTAPFGGIVSTANTIQLAIESIESRKALIASPAFTGTPTAPTAARTVSSTQIATTAHVHSVANSGVVLSHSIDGNAATVTNGLYSNQSYSQPAWLTSISSNIINGTVTRATYLDGTQLDTQVVGQAQSMAMSTDSTTRGSFVARATGAGDSNLAGMTYWNDNYAIKLGVRADGYFGLGGWSRTAWSWYSDPSGNMVAAGNVTAYSDPRLKEGFERVPNALDIIDQLDGGTFYWKSGYKHTEMKAGKKDYGILADQVEAVMPEIVTDSIDIEGETYKTVAYDKLVPVLIEAIKELRAEVEALKGNNK